MSKLFTKSAAIAVSCGIALSALVPSAASFAYDEQPDETRTSDTQDLSAPDESSRQAPDEGEGNLGSENAQEQVAPLVEDASAEGTGAEPQENIARESTKSTDSGQASHLQESLVARLPLLDVASADTSSLGTRGPIGGSLSSDNEAEFRDLFNAVRVDLCLPIVNYDTALSTKARSWGTTVMNRGWVSTQSNLLSLSPNADWVGQSVIGSYDWLTGYDFLLESAYDYEVAAMMVDPEVTDVGVGIVYNGAGFNSTNVTNFAAITKNQKGHFLDVRPWSKFYREINWMGTAGLSSGNKIEGCTGETTYNPKDRVSREAMAAFLYRLSGENYTAPRVSPFADVKPTDKFYREIAWMHKRNISTGTARPGQKPVFAPKDQISREAMAAFLYRFSNSKYRGPSSSPFSDMTPKSKFYNEISWMHSSGLSTGNQVPGSKPAYAPKEKVTREAMAAFIYRMDH
ncbi:S-layer homology domain-containing protein [Leucobacter sp. HY1908]